MLEKMIGELMQAVKIPGLSIAIIINGKKEYAHGFGSRDMGRNLPMTPDTLFGIGSISKSFAALAINLLAEQGKLNLNDSVKKYIDFNLGKRKNSITIHHLLTHTSGVNAMEGNFIYSERIWGVSDSFIPMSSTDDFLLFLNGAKKEVFDEPGKVFIYNNDMYACLGLIVEKVTGMKFQEFVKEYILKPLDMKRSTYYADDYEGDIDVALGYVLDIYNKLIARKPAIFNLDAALGGLLSSVNELSNYMIFHLNEGIYNGNQIIEKYTHENMWKSYINTDKKNNDYGYGWIIDKDFFGHTLIHHSGDAFISSGYIGMIPEKKMGVVIGQNITIMNMPEIIGRAILGILLGASLEESLPILSIFKKIQLLLGHYETYKGVMKVDVVLEGGIFKAKMRYPNTSHIIEYPIVIENFDELKFFIPIPIPGQEIKGQAFIDGKNGNVNLKVNRWTFHKIIQ